MGWVANIFLVVGQLFVVRRRRTAFVFFFIGEATWCAAACVRGQLDLVFISGLFMLLNAYAWYKWGEYETL